MKVVAIVQARMRSTRLPGKVLKDLAGHPMLYHVVTRIQTSTRVDEVIVATSNSDADRQIVSFAEKYGISTFTGSEYDVLDRYVNAARHVSADQIVRITGDCPLIDPATISETVDLHLANDADYTGNLARRTLPRGLDVEVVSVQVLQRIHQMKLRPHHREHVTAFIYENPDRFRIQHFMARGKLRRPDLRLTVDTREDMLLLDKIYRCLYIPDTIVDVAKVIEWLDAKPLWRSINLRSEEEHLFRNVTAGVQQVKLPDTEEV